MQNEAAHAAAEGSAVCRRWGWPESRLEGQLHDTRFHLLDPACLKTFQDRNYSAA